MLRQKRTFSMAFLVTFLMMTLLLVCAGCSSKVQTKILTPPENLLADCQTPEAPAVLSTATNFREFSIAATRHIIDQRKALDMCNGDKAALREWSRKVQEK